MNRCYAARPDAGTVRFGHERRELQNRQEAHELASFTERDMHESRSLHEGDYSEIVITSGFWAPLYLRGVDRTRGKATSCRLQPHNLPVAHEIPKAASLFKLPCATFISF
jgi:hypothetical protein